ncbi:MAG: hypothetical protein GY703_10735 [Gammaproteobacteria bacterium]|nr:hypothetical protein [Gammaproteobacteria bacterium]
MDQDAFLKTCREYGERTCLYEKGILSGQCDCPQAVRTHIAERVVVHCRSEEAKLGCEELLSMLQDQAVFTLKMARGSTVLPHAKAIRVQIGGLRGLHVVTYDTPSPPMGIDNIHGLIQDAVNRFSRLDKLPFQEIIKQIAAYQGRKRGSRG